MIKVYAIKSILSKSDESVTKESLKLLNDLKELTREEFVLVDSPKDLKGSGLSLILVQTGGSEGFCAGGADPTASRAGRK